MKVKLIFYLGINLCKYFMLSIAMRLWCGIIPFHKSTLHSTSLHFTLHWMIVMLNTFCNRIASWTIESFKFVSVRVMSTYFSIFIRKKLKTFWWTANKRLFHTAQSERTSILSIKLTACTLHLYTDTCDTFTLGAIISIFAIFGASPLSNWFCCVVFWCVLDSYSSSIPILFEKWFVIFNRNRNWWKNATCNSFVQ